MDKFQSEKKWNQYYVKFEPDPQWDKSYDQFPNEKPLPPYVIPYIKQQQELEKAEKLKTQKNLEGVSNVINKSDNIPLIFQKLEDVDQPTIKESEPIINNSKVNHPEAKSSFEALDQLPIDLSYEDPIDERLISKYKDSFPSEKYEYEEDYQEEEKEEGEDIKPKSENVPLIFQNIQETNEYTKESEPEVNNSTVVHPQAKSNFEILDQLPIDLSYEDPIEERLISKYKDSFPSEKYEYEEDYADQDDFQEQIEVEQDRLNTIERAYLDSLIIVEQEQPKRTSPLIFEKVEDNQIQPEESKPFNQNSKVVIPQTIVKPTEDYPKFELPQKQFYTDDKSIQYYLKTMDKKNKLKEFLQQSSDSQLNNCVINWCGGFDHCKDYASLGENLKKCINMLYRPVSSFSLPDTEINQERCIMQCQLNEGMKMDNINFWLKDRKKNLQDVKSWMKQKQDILKLDQCVLNSDSSWKYFTQEAFTENNTFEVNKFLEKQISDCFNQFKPSSKITKCQYKCMFDRTKAYAMMDQIKSNFSNEFDNQLRADLAKRYIN